MGDEIEVEENKFCGILRVQDYAKECFELSRSIDEPFTATVEKAWLGDLSKYMVELEEKVKYYLAKPDKRVLTISELEEELRIANTIEDLND